MKRLVAALLGIVVAGAAALVLAQSRNTKAARDLGRRRRGRQGRALRVADGPDGADRHGLPGARDLDRIMAAIADAGVKQIDYLISTHYHVDHIGSLTELAKRIPIGTFVDHGPTVEGPNVTQIPPGPDGLTLTKPREQIEGFQAAYAELYGKAKRLVVKPGDRVPITGLEWRIATAAGNVLKTPLPGGGRPNPSCANFTPLPTNEGMVDPDDFHSVGSVVILGQFRARRFRRHVADQGARADVSEQSDRDGRSLLREQSRRDRVGLAAVRARAPAARRAGAERHAQGRPRPVR